VVELGGLIVVDVDDALLGDGLAGDALSDPQAVELECLALGRRQARVVRPDEGLAVGVVLVDDRAVGAEESTRLVDDRLEDLVRLAQGGDPGSYLAQRALRLRPALDVGLGPRERLHQVGVDDGDRGVRRERGQRLDVRLRVGARLA
jgi:hypothetical protein